MDDLKRLIMNALSDESISPMATDELMSTLPKTSEEICECILARHKAGFNISEDKILCPVCRKIQPIKKTIDRNSYRKCPCCGEEITSFYRTNFMFTNIIFVCPPAVISPAFLRVDMKCELVTENVEVKIKILSKEEGSVSKFLINDSSWVTVPIRLYDTAKLIDAFKKHFKYSGCDAFKEKLFWIADSLTYCLLYMKYPYIELLLKTKYEYAISELITNYTDSGEKHFKRNFKDGNSKYIVVVPETPQDLINEGRNNRNCVGSYIQSFANGKSNIFFIRRKETPNTSYVTLEMRGSKITQAYLSSNRTITDKQTLAFIDEWQEHLKKEKIIIDHTK